MRTETWALGAFVLMFALLRAARLASRSVFDRIRFRIGTADDPFLLGWPSRAWFRLMFALATLPLWLCLVAIFYAFFTIRGRL